MRKMKLLSALLALMLLTGAVIPALASGSDQV